VIDTPWWIWVAVAILVLYAVYPGLPACLFWWKRGRWRSKRQKWPVWASCECCGHQLHEPPWDVTDRRTGVVRVLCVVCMGVFARDPKRFWAALESRCFTPQKPRAWQEKGEK